MTQPPCTKHGLWAFLFALLLSLSLTLSVSRSVSLWPWKTITDFICIILNHVWASHVDRIQSKTWYVAWVQTDNPALLFCMDKSSLGVSRIGVATPWGDCQYAESIANTLVRARAYRVFLTSCVWINLGDILRGLWHPRDVLHTRSENPIRALLPQVLLQCL